MVCRGVPRTEFRDRVCASGECEKCGLAREVVVVVPAEMASEEQIGPLECMMGTLETKPVLAQCSQLTLRLRDCTPSSAKRLSHHLKKAKLLKVIVVIESDVGCSNLVAVAVGAALRNGTGAPLEALSSSISSKLRQLGN